MAEIKEFSQKVAEEIKHYVYRLIDPRNGNTFYVGKGKGNRVFEHVNAQLKFKDEEGAEDATSTKISTIREIHSKGLEVIHVVHRHGLDEDTALEVEAALIDAYPGLTNIMGGHGSNERGAMNTLEIIQLYEAETIENIDDKCIIIKVQQSTIEENNNDTYKATRSAWKLSRTRAEKAQYVLSVVNGLVKEVYTDLEWTAPDWADGRLEFTGKVAQDEIRQKYVGKRIPSDYCKKGSANPCQYANI